MIFNNKRLVFPVIIVLFSLVLSVDIVVAQQIKDDTPVADTIKTGNDKPVEQDLVSKEELERAVKAENLRIEKLAKERNMLAAKLAKEREQRFKDSLRKQRELTEEANKRWHLEQVRYKEIEESKRKDKKLQATLLESSKAKRDLYRFYLLGTVIFIVVIGVALIVVLFALNVKRKANNDLEKQKSQIEEQKAIIEEKNKVLGKSLEQIQIQNKSIEEQKAVIEEKNKVLGESLEQIQIKNKSIEEQKAIIEEKNKVLGESLEQIQIKNKSIEEQKAVIEEKNKILGESLEQIQIKNKSIEEQKAIIEEKNKVLGESLEQIQIKNKSIEEQKAVIEEKNKVLGESLEKIQIKNKSIEEQKAIIEKKNKVLGESLEQIKYQNKHIEQSVNYAYQIQQALFSSKNLLNNILEESFIVFKPKDVVSGDFYWFSEVNKNTDNHKIIVSAVDCTGHGIPGALMSMLGFNLFSNIVRTGVYAPDEILNQLHKGVRVALNQDVTDNRDGMDMTVCVIDVNKKIMEFAGAQNPLVFIKNDKIHRIRGNKYPVGGYLVDETKFTKHVVKIDEPTYCYIFSDGFADQFGGHEHKKFMTKNMRNLISEIHNMPMQEQAGILELVTEEWRGDFPQIDDILIIGFKLDF